MESQQESSQVLVESIDLKSLTYKDGVPRITWTEEEVAKMNIIEDLQLAVIGKISYHWSDLEDIRKQIPTQCNIKGDCKISPLRNKHTLMIFNQMEDYVNMLKNVYYIIAKDNTR